jgi:AcrR family transcriptional regulator
MLTNSANRVRHRRFSGPKRRAQIIEAATGLFSKHGYDNLTMKMLADACSVTEPALYRYFASKENIFEAVIQSLESRLDPEMLRERLAQSKEPEEVLRTVSTYLVTTFSEHTELQRLLLYSTLGSHPQAQAAFDSVRKPYVEMLQEKLESLATEGKIRQVNPVITARCFIGMVMDCALGMHLWCDYQGDSFAPQQVIGNNVPIFAAGLLPEAQK